MTKISDIIMKQLDDMNKSIKENDTKSEARHTESMSALNNFKDDTSKKFDEVNNKLSKMQVEIAENRKDIQYMRQDYDQNKLKCYNHDQLLKRHDDKLTNLEKKEIEDNLPKNKAQLFYEFIKDLPKSKKGILAILIILGVIIILILIILFRPELFPK